jgi:uncharacterized protein YjbJ (UPF0337 family)
MAVNSGKQTIEDVMDKDRVKGSAQQVAGGIKEGAGKAMGDEKLKAEGKMEKAEGKVRNAVGSAKDALREADDHGHSHDHSHTHKH